MSFISYAQNYEDVMLWRVFKGVSNGFYIDVGANDPVIDSVTKAFYDRGWSGINIEPILAHYQDLVEDRQRDINLGYAVGSGAGELEIWETDVRGWATLDKSVIAQHVSSGHDGSFHVVTIRTLADICVEHVHREIHFLKIDVEGFEKSVLQGADFVNYRPWVVVIEATKPNSTIEVYLEWEYILLKANYSFVYADGLNRFYLANEHANLCSEFLYPPNPFDEFVSSRQLNAELSARDSEALAQKANEHARLAEAQAKQASERATLAEVQAKQASERATLAEVQAKQANERASLAEAQAKQASECTTLAEVQVKQAALRVALAEVQAQQAESLSHQHIIQINAIFNSLSWRITKPLRVINAVLRSIVGKSLRSAARKSKILVRQVPVLRRILLSTLRRSSFLRGVVARFSDVPVNVAMLDKMQIRSFESLRSVRVMQALSKLPAHKSDGSVFFLEVSDDVC